MFSPSAPLGSPPPTTTSKDVDAGESTPSIARSSQQCSPTTYTSPTVCLSLLVANLLAALTPDRAPSIDGGFTTKPTIDNLHLLSPSAYGVQLGFSLKLSQGRRKLLQW